MACLTLAILFIIALSALACSAVTPTPTPEPTPTPQFVALPPPGILTDMITEEADSGFRYLPWHYIPEDTTVWLVFGWPEEDDRIYKAVFAFVDGEWVLLEVEPVGEEGREAWGEKRKE